MTKFVSFVSGKGGVGKTTSTLNVGQAISEMGHKVVLLDANLVTPNLALQLGFVNPKATLNNFLRKEKDLKSVTYQHESGVSIIPSSPSYKEYQKSKSEKLVKVFEHLDDKADFVLVDAPSGLGQDVVEVLKHTDEAFIVVNPNLSSVMDALKTIKLALEHGNTISGVILNMSNFGWHEMKPQEIADILGHQVIANIRFTGKMRKSLHKQMPLHYIYPRSSAAKEFKNVALHLTHRWQ